MQTQDNFKCRINCRHRECQCHQVYLGVNDPNKAECSNTLPELTGSIFLENVLDLSHILAQIMIVCGIHEWKAKSAVDVIIYCLLNYDLVWYCLEARPSKKLRKEDLFHQLGRKCLMNRVEAQLCYSIIKRGFRAFYYFPHGEEAALAAETNEKSFSEECLYVHAAKRTAEYFGRFEGLSGVEQLGVEAKIMGLYKKFYERLQMRKTKPAAEKCNCCFCAKTKQHCGVYVAAAAAPLSPSPCPCVEEEKTRKKHTCRHCCKKRKSRKLQQPVGSAEKCAACKRFAKFCCCPKYQFDPNWVASIWSRPDMNLYYLENIEKKPIENLAECSQQSVLEVDESQEAVEEEQEKEEQADQREEQEAQEKEEQKEQEEQEAQEEQDKQKQLREVIEVAEAEADANVEENLPEPEELRFEVIEKEVDDIEENEDTAEEKNQIIQID